MISSCTWTDVGLHQLYDVLSACGEPPWSPYHARRDDAPARMSYVTEADVTRSVLDIHLVLERVGADQRGGWTCSQSPMDIVTGSYARCRGAALMRLAPRQVIATDRYGYCRRAAGVSRWAR